MRLSRLSITNYRALRDVTIPLSRFGCLIGENNSGKSSFLQALSLFFSGSRVSPSHFFDESLPIRIAVTFEDIGPADLARLAEEHRQRVAVIVKNGRLVLARVYGIDGKSSLFYNCLTPSDARFSAENVAALVKGQRPGPSFVSKVLQTFPELDGILDATMDQDAVKQRLRDLAESLPDSEKTAADQPLPTGIDKSIEPMLPERIYIPAVKDLADDIKTSESTPFGRLLAILLPAVLEKLPDAQQLFDALNINLNRVQGADGNFLDGRLEEVRFIESTIEKYVRESFADVAVQISIPPPELKAVLSSAKIFVNDGVDGLIDSKGDGLRRAIVFSILRSYVDVRERLSAAKPPEDSTVAAVGPDSQPAPAPTSYLLLFEEPELFLHPKAQRVLFDALRVFSREHHVLATTHSPLFFGPGATGTFVKLRKTSDVAIAPRPFTQAQPVDLSDVKAKDQFQIICFENNNAAFFADTVVLVEGDSDLLVMPHVARTLDPSWDVNRSPVTFVRITGKGNIRRYRDFFSRFDVRVPVIADLDLLIDGFDHISPDSTIKTARDALLSKVDELIVPDASSPSAGEARAAYDSRDLRSLWRRVKERHEALKAGTCTQEDMEQAIEDFFAWQRRQDRLTVLKKSSDQTLLQLKWRLLGLLRAVDVFVLERGAIEDYYPDSVSGADKPSRAQDFCTKVATRDGLLACCRPRAVEIGSKSTQGVEFALIFGSIFSKVR